MPFCEIFLIKIKILGKWVNFFSNYFAIFTKLPPKVSKFSANWLQKFFKFKKKIFKKHLSKMFPKLRYNFSAWFTFSSRVLVKIFEELWARWGTHKWRHLHSYARTMRQVQRLKVMRQSRVPKIGTQFYSSTFFTQLQTTIYIQELNEDVITEPSITRRNILVSFYSELIYCLVYILVDTFEKLWTRQGTHECRHSHCCARTMRQVQLSKVMRQLRVP